MLTALLLFGAVGALARAVVVPPEAAQLAEDVAALTAPEMEGRRSGTAGGDRAARRIADWLAAAGLRPAGDHGSFLQTFVIETSSRIGPANSLELLVSPARRLEPGRDWTPHGGSLAAEINGDVVFVGYGADLPDGSYDDYASVDVHGKIALALDGTPPYLGAARVSRLAKLIAAKSHGAAGLLIVVGTLPAPTATAVPVALVSAAITPEAADALLAPSGRTAAALAKALATTRAPVSFATGARARIKVDMARDELRGANVVGILPGADPALATEAVVIGAHYDHLGRVDGVVHPGADDNASGTAVVLGLARSFAAAGGTSRTLVFVLFGAEELGLLGSGHYVREPAVPLTRTVAMLNFDMVGRMQGTRLNVGGADSGSGLRALVSDAAQQEGVALDLHGTPYGPSDHSRFYDAGLPALFLSTGGHGDHHRATDTPDKINPAGMARVAAVAARAIEQLAADARPVYAKVPRPARPSGARGGPFLGVIAAPRPAADGLWLTGVLPGTAAARAGLREGDVIVRFAGVAVDGLEDLRSLLLDRRPGDTVPVVYLRNGEARATAATLGTPVE